MKTLNIGNFNEIHLRLASPDQIREWSFGDVTVENTKEFATQVSSVKNVELK